MQEAELGATLGSRSLPSLGLGGVGGLRGTRSEPWEGAVGGKFCPRGQKRGCCWLLAPTGHGARGYGVWGQCQRPVLGSLLDFCPLGTGNKDTGGSGILPAGFSSAHSCAEPCNVPQNCAAPRAPPPARGDPGLGGTGGRSEERHTKGTQVQREPCHHAIKRRRKTIPVIAKLVRSTGAILWLFKPTCGPITAWLEPSEGKAAKCILLPVVSFTIF